MKKRWLLLSLFFLVSCQETPVSSVMPKDPSKAKETLTDFNGKTVLKSVLESDSAFPLRNTNCLIGSLNSDARIRQEGDTLSLDIYAGAHYDSQYHFQGEYKDIGTRYNLMLGYYFVTDEESKFIDSVWLNDLCYKPQDYFLDFYKFTLREEENHEGREDIYANDVAVYHCNPFAKKIELKDYQDFLIQNPEGKLFFDFYIETMFENNRQSLSGILSYDSRYRETSIGYHYENGKMTFENPVYREDGVMKC